MRRYLPGLAAALAFLLRLGYEFMPPAPAGMASGAAPDVLAVVFAAALTGALAGLTVRLILRLFFRP